MKNILILATLLSFLSCQKNLNRYQEEKHFDPKELSNLSLDTIDTFWGIDSAVTISNYFNHYPEYTGGIELKGDHKGIAVAVFESQEKAIECMERRIKLVANVIIPGVPNEILQGKWWYPDGLNNVVFANQWNTIIEVSYGGSEYEEVRILVMETAAEIIKRIDSLSQ